MTARSAAAEQNAPDAHRGALRVSAAASLEPAVLALLQRCETATSCGACDPGGALALQRLAGNRATRVALHREVAAPAAAPSDQNSLLGDVYVDEATAREFAEEAIRTLSPFGVTINHPPVSLASNASARQVQTWPAERALMRAGRFKPEAGVVGSVQGSYDPITGEASVEGWIWFGAGVAAPGLGGSSASFWGAYAFYEGELWKGKLDFMPRLPAGTCDPACKPETSGGWGAGFTGFPFELKPGEWGRFKTAGVEVGGLLTPHSFCDADLELIVLVDVTKCLGPIGVAVETAVGLANRVAKKINVEIDCGLGVQGSGHIHLCKSASGWPTCDDGTISLGGYVGCAIGLGHDPAMLPGGHPSGHGRPED